MNLRNGNITVGELLANPKVWELLQREAAGLANYPMLRMASGMTLNQLERLACLLYTSPPLPGTT